MNTSNNIMPQIGDWYLMEFGSDTYMWYVVSVDNQHVKMSKKNWLVSCAYSFPLQKIETATYIGRGTLRWWWKYIPWRDLICPFSLPIEYYLNNPTA